MHDLGDIIYYVILITGVVISFIIKSKKKTDGRPKPVLGEPWPGFEPNKHEPVIVKEPASPIADYIPKKGYKPVYPSYENTEQSIQGVADIPDENRVQRSARMNEIIDSFDIHSAVVYSEILKPKYF